MKVLQLNNYYYDRGGSENVMLEEARFLATIGIEVEVFSRQNRRNFESRFSSLFPPDINTASIQYDLKSLKNFFGIIYSAGAKSKLKLVLDNYQPDLAHAHNIYGRLSTSVLDLLSQHQIPTVMTLHDYKLICPSYLMLNNGSICEACKGGSFYRAIIKKCHKGSVVASAVYAIESLFNFYLDKYKSVKYFISPSEFLKKKCVEHGWSPENIFYVPNFTDTANIAPSYKYDNYFLYLGRLSHEKGVLTLLKAFCKMNSSINLLLVGDGPERYKLERFVADNQINAHFKGHLSGNELREIISNSRALIMPSEWYENAPLVLLEAFSHGKPVLGSRIGGIPEVIDDGINGHLFEPGNVFDLQSKLLAFSNLPMQRVLEMGRAAREKVERFYSIENHCEKLMHVYRKAMNQQCT